MAILFIFFVLITNHVNGKPTKVLNEGPLNGPHVFLTVNALSGVSEGNETTGLTNRMLEVNWQNLDIQSNDWIGIFDHDPLSNSFNKDQKSLALENYAVQNGTGYQLTNIRFAEINLANFSPAKDFCLVYHVAYFRNNKPIKTNCLRMYPDWMNQMKNIIGNVPLHSLMIPGTHDAGAWHIFNGTEEDESTVVKFTYTQEESIFNQLAYGIRYLDVRVAYYPNTEEIFWVNHGMIRIYPLISLLNDVREFTIKYKEIILMDFHNFPVGFDTPQVHEKLYDFVLKIMGQILAPHSLSKDVTLNQLWANKTSIIWTYGDPFHKERDLLWPTLQHAWGNVNEELELETYLNNAMAEFGCQGKFWSAMAELTPKGPDFFDPDHGLRPFAQQVNIPLTKWFQHHQWYSRANIISTDYFLGNNIIEMIIQGNRERVTCS